MSVLQKRTMGPKQGNRKPMKHLFLFLLLGLTPASAQTTTVNITTYADCQMLFQQFGINWCQPQALVVVHGINRAVVAYRVSILVSDSATGKQFEQRLFTDSQANFIGNQEADIAASVAFLLQPTWSVLSSKAVALIPLPPAP
jgi:hypothetical protein